VHSNELFFDNLLLKGKTTLLKIILGDLEPISGFRQTHRALRIGYFAQHHIDALNMNCNSVELMQNKFPG
jgi:ATP-binding cassette subfamily F protein 3